MYDELIKSDVTNSNESWKKWLKNERKKVVPYR